MINWHWVTIIWSMNAAVCLALAFSHFSIWYNRRAARGSLFFSLTALSTTLFAAVEYGMFRSETVEGYGVALWYLQLPTWIMMLAMCGYFRVHLRAGRVWLAWVVCGVRTLVYVLNYFCTPNINFREITSLRHVSIFGDSISMGVGPPNPWLPLAHVSLLLFLAFVLDASFQVWRRGERRTQWLAGAISLFVVGGVLQAILVFWGVLHLPITISAFYFGIVMVMGFEMSYDLIRAVQLGDELRMSESRMALAAGAADLGFWSRNFATGEFWASEQWRRMYGFSPSERVDFERVSERIHPDDRAMVQRVRDEARLGQGSYETEFRVVLPDGRIVWTLSRGVVEFDSAHRPVAIRGVSIDVTARKRAEDLFRLVIEAAPAAIVMVDPKGLIVLVNFQMEAVSGYTRQELVGQPVAMLVPEHFAADHPDQVFRYFSAAEARPMGRGRELAVRRKDGGEVPVEIGLNPIRTDERMLVLATIIDISARKKAEEALRLAIEGAEYGVYSYEFATGEVFNSNELLSLYGLPPNATLELDAELVPKQLHPQDREHYLARQQVANDPTGAGSFDVDFRIVRPDGTERWLRSHGRTVFTGQGAERWPLHAAGVVQDITARKVSEQEISRQRDELTHLSRVNTLGELAGSLAHELNQPLTAILSNAQAAQRFIESGTADLGEIREILEDIVTQDKRAGEVIRRLRLLLKKGEVRHQPLVVADLILEVLTLVRSDLLNHGVTAHTEFASNLPLVPGDRVQLQQVLINLVMNATDAMAGADRSERHLTFRTSLVEPDLVCISVMDVGTGIHPEKLEQIFEPYYSTKPQGMGLGLAVCRSIITAHGGRLWATCNPGPGSTIHFTLPLDVTGL